MRVLVVLVAAALLLSGCSLEREWKGDLAFKVTKVNPPYTDKSDKAKPAYVNLDLDQAEPDSVSPLGKKHGADLDRFPSDVAVGDQVVCAVRQYDANGFDGGNVEVTIGPCRRP
ncbi:hypothetical protein [Umezawaea sp. Da 62-37]|uniref:hypothetical protein n=1 Tax=Umezawaea sp. Da 62-37 TaxID=3075927 RepID=UPI0028F7396A|nr:hypothetical protein [Umezawaea sp. Da 62-37]WNV91183.1 hypothetical protein RM788_23770 [Umezawaea sp. Da 62-37]